MLIEFWNLVRNEPASPVPAQKKRKRKDIKKAPNAEDITKKLKMGNLRIKAAARTAPLVGMNVKNSGQDRQSKLMNIQMTKQAKSKN